MTIPRGETRPYGWIARQAGRPRAVRAAASALAANPVPLLIPCHRIVQADGVARGYVFGTPRKEALLQHEGANLDEVRDLAAAGTRYLASDTTGVVCFPSCRNARRITPAHRRGFASLAAAGRSGFRPAPALPALAPRSAGRLRRERLMTTRLRQRWLLAVLVACEFMANVDIAIVNVATPSIHRDLHASGGALEFVVSGYVLAFAMLIITGARLGRIAGYRRVYLAGLAGFTLASLACSLAPETGALIGARIAQGACAAVMVPQVLTGIQVSFDGRAPAGRSASWS